jgi:hypothetical protein
MILLMSMGDPFGALHNMYICMKEGYDALLDLEEWGVKIRDIDGHFEGAPFRDAETKLLFAYNLLNLKSV